MTENAAVLERQVAAIRQFNRFYTGRIGVLQEGLVGSPFSLTEARLLYELAHRDGVSAGALARDLALDPGYLSRALRGLERRGLVSRKPAPDDGRRMQLALTDAGRDAFAGLDAASRDAVTAMLDPVGPEDRDRLVGAMARIERLLDGAPTAARLSNRVPARLPAYLLRPHRPGDMGWVIHRHGALYAAEYHWDETFEALVAEICADFIRNFDPKRDCCWIAEQDGVIVGSAFVVHGDQDGVAKFRLLYVEPSARGLGIGKRLVEECLRFARQAGYRTMTLWTNDILVAARRIYEAAGFHLVAEAPHHSFGHDLVGQTWERAL